jgi:hypothetical protein
LFGLFRRPGKLNAAGFASAPNEYLRFHYHSAIDALSNGASLFGGCSDFSLRHRNAKLPKHALGLKLL